MLFLFCCLLIGAAIAGLILVPRYLRHSALQRLGWFWNDKPDLKHHGWAEPTPVRHRSELGDHRPRPRVAAGAGGDDAVPPPRFLRPDTGLRLARTRHLAQAGSGDRRPATGALTNALGSRHSSLARKSSTGLPWFRRPLRSLVATVKASSRLWLRFSLGSHTVS